MNEASERAVGPRCPTYGLAIAWAENLARPFCSLGCELIDLGGWLDATRRVPGPPLGLPDSPVPAATRHHA